MDTSRPTTRAKSPGVSSRLYEPTAASRSRATAVTAAGTAAGPTAGAKGAAVPLSLRGLGGSTGQPSVSARRGASPTATTGVSTAGALSPTGNATAGRVANEGTRRTPVRTRKTTTTMDNVLESSTATTASAVGTHRSATPTTTSRRPMTSAGAPTSRSTMGATAGNNGHSDDYNGRDIPKAPSPARFASVSPSRSPARITTATKRSATPAANVAAAQSRTAVGSRLGASSRGTSPSASTTARSRSTGATATAAARGKKPSTTTNTTPSRQKGSNSLSALGSMGYQREISMSPDGKDAAVVTVPLSPVRRLPSMSTIKEHMETLITAEELARVEVSANEEIELWQAYEALLIEQKEVVISRIQAVNKAVEVRDKRRRTEELKEACRKAKEEMVEMRKSIAHERAYAKEVTMLKEQLAALNNYRKIHDAKIRQKQATMDFLRRTTQELADSGDVLNARLYVEVEEILEVVEFFAQKDKYSDSKHCKPLECMATLAEIDFMREMTFEGLVTEVDERKVVSAAVNDEMKVVMREREEMLAEQAELSEVDKQQMLQEWAVEKRQLEKQMKALKREIADLNFQIRRGSNIKSLSQLPSGGGRAIERNRTRELCLDVETQKVELEQLRIEHNKLKERCTDLKTYYNNKEEDHAAITDKATRERLQLEYVKDTLREEVIKMQAGMLMYNSALDGEGSAITAGPSSSAAGDGQTRHIKDRSASPMGTTSATSTGNAYNRNATTASALDDIDDDASPLKATTANKGGQQRASSSARPPAQPQILTPEEALRVLSEMEAREHEGAQAVEADFGDEAANHNDDGDDGLSWNGDTEADATAAAAAEGYDQQAVSHGNSRAASHADPYTNSSAPHNNSAYSAVGYQSAYDVNALKARYIQRSGRAADGDDANAPEGGAGNASSGAAFAQPAPQLVAARAAASRGLNRSRTPTTRAVGVVITNKKADPLLDRLCKPTAKFASYVEARVQEDDSRRETKQQMNGARPDARH